MFAFVGKKAEQKTKSRDVLEELIVGTLAEIRVLSNSYWTEDEKPESKVLATQIVALNDALPVLNTQLFESNLEITRQQDIIMNKVSRATTGGEFQQRNRKANLHAISETEKQVIALKVMVQLEKAKLPHPWS